MTMPFYVSPEQVMKDRADYARKGIARGRSLVALECAAGVLIVADNASRTLSKISEIYDRIAFAAVGKYNEFQLLKVAGVRHADLKGYSYSREDVSAKELANAYGLSKEAINAYTAVRSFTLAAQGIRINCLNPGPTDTPMMPAFEQANGVDFMREFPKPIGRNSRPEEQAWPLVFLGSPRASYVTGVSVFADGGFTGALFTGQVDFARLMPPGFGQ